MSNMLIGIFGGSVAAIAAGIALKFFRKNEDNLEKFWQSLDDKLEDYLFNKFGIRLPQIVHNIHDEIAHRTIIWMEKYAFTKENLTKFFKAVIAGKIPDISIDVSALFESLEDVNEIKDLINTKEELKEAFNKFKQNEVVDIVDAELRKNGQELPKEKIVETIRLNVLAAKPITNDATEPATKEDIINSFKAEIEKSKLRKEALKK